VLFAQRFDAGLRIGFCGSQVNGDRLSGFNKVGLLGGGYVKRSFNGPLSVQMEMIFIQKGSRKPTDVNNTFYRMRVTYIEIPLLLSWKASSKLQVTAGPSYGVLVSSREDDEFGIYPNPIPFRKFEIAGNAGIIYYLSDSWSVDARYSQSISTIRPYPGGSTRFFDKGQYNVLIEFSLLYSL
jgi:hypothetical protein